MKKNTKMIVTVALAAVLLVTAMIMETALVFRITTEQANDAGRTKLKEVSGQLEDTINDARANVMSLALGAQPLSDNKDELEKFITMRKKELEEDSDGVCYNAYAAGTGWAIIPDFDAPDDYIACKRSWYMGARRSMGSPYVTDPYVDAATGRICYTVSVMLGDGDTVVALDYNMERIKEHIQQMYANGEREAVIVTEQGIIAGCTDPELVGKDIITGLPDYAEVFSLAKAGSDTVNVRRRGDNMFAVRSAFGWFLIVSENDLSFYKNAFLPLTAMLGISLIVFTVLIYMYLTTARAAKKAEDALDGKEKFLSRITAGLQEPLQRIIAGSSPDNIRSSTDYEAEFESIRSAGSKLSEMIAEITSYNSIVSTEKKKKRLRLSSKELTVDRHFKRLISIALTLVFVMSMYINTIATYRWGRGQMKEELKSCTGQMKQWVSTQKSILDMFCSVISTDPNMLKDYDGMVDYLDDITVQYPDISASYITNPEWEHTVIMNNGWEPSEDWHVEDRDWFRQLEASEEGWCISAPYFDEQTGLYCVTLAEKVMDAKTGAYLGSFGIDFYMDKLVNILGEKYAEDGYAFMCDAEGTIISHPNTAYRMTDDKPTNVAELPYISVKPDADDISFIIDYDGKVRAIMADSTDDAGFTVYLSKNVGSVYSGILMYGVVCLVILLVCIIAVYMLTNNLIAMQDEAKRQLKQSADSAIAADEAKSSFLAQMSHEIRTPINAVLGMNEMILRECTDDDIKEYAVNIQSAGRTLLSLINSILDFSKIEDGKMEIIPAAYGTASMINDLVTAVSARAAAKDLTLKVNADPALPAKLIGDDMRIKQVISNLLTNAVKYTEKGSVMLTVKEEDLTEKDMVLYVEVADTGIGIKEEDIGALFETFRRLDEKRNRSIEGTGLGMSIVTKLLAMMGSELHVESIYGVGSTFWFRLKQSIADSSPMGKYSSRSVTHHSENAKHIFAPEAKVLVVDDNEMNIKVAVSLMKMYGIVPETASSGYMALSMIREKRYDVILLDHMMPGMDGIETLNMIDEQGMRDAETTIIALTANAVVGAKESYLRAGFDDYLTKPIESQLLEKALKKYLPAEKVTMVTEEEKKAAEKVQPDSFTVGELQKMCEMVSGLNPVLGMEYCMGSREFYLDTLAGYVDADKSEKLAEAFGKSDFDGYRVLIHSVKSAALTVGLQLLSEHAKLLEFASRDGDEGYVRAKHEEVFEEYKASIAGVKAVIEYFSEAEK
ncbi:hybrid sensor histidine kinase/response regulator [Ruminococcus sp.]|uniref:hybrid sensor histidine kinase/response regulator n=1 Tax=Ruminococcus sp. TaxID=41978 RepID=UPI0025EE2C20|nr:hybrid sensor histidine kinase/response regulator [Ruminococcus sp.]MBQ9542540.1 response regulator [Ruminococcus sp.]